MNWLIAVEQVLSVDAGGFKLQAEGTCLSPMFHTSNKAIVRKCFQSTHTVQRVSQQQLSVYLQIILRVPVRIVDDNCVSSRQVDAQPSSSSTQQEDKPIRVCKKSSQQQSKREALKLWMHTIGAGKTRQAECEKINNDHR